MKRKIVIALATAVIATGAAFVLGLVVEAVTPPGASPAAKSVTSLLQPDTRSPYWRPLSDDVGVMLRPDDRTALRGRLFARVDGVWRPVPIDGLADIGGVAPVN